MATTFLKRSTLAQLLKRLQEEETDESGRVLSVVKAVNDMGEVGNLYEARLQRPDEEARTLSALLLKGTTPEAQRAEIAAELKKENAPLDYTVIAVQEAGGEAKDENVLFSWSDGGAWAKSLVSATHRIEGVAKRIPWASGVQSALSFAGLHKGALASFKNPTGGPDVVAAVTDADIDTDGPGGSRAKDRWWSANTSLRFPSGNSCDSRNFPGVVTPPALRKEYGIEIGDLAWVSWKGKEFGAQVYDSGPTEKIGEISFGLAVDLGIYADRSEATEAKAATKGNDVKDLLTVFFPGSGNGTAMPPEAIERAGAACVRQWLREMPPAEAAVFATAASSFSQFFASLALSAFFTAAEALEKTDVSPNSPPPQALWPNIAPTLAVLAEVRNHFNAPLRFHSTYRNPDYNVSRGGVPRSQHLAFRAVDFSIEGVSPATVAEYARSLRGKPFTVALPGLMLSNAVANVNPPPLDVAKLNFRPSAAGGTDFTFHGGVQDYPTFVHVDCRGEDSEWG